MSAPELKPCPFCGHPPYNDEQTAHVFGIRTGHNWAVACSNCEVSAPGDQTLSGAIAAWNTRVTDARLADAEAMAEALRGAEVTIQNLINVMRTPDQRQCCDGRECGCMGATVYQEAEYYAGKELKAVVAALEKWRAGK